MSVHNRRRRRADHDDEHDGGMERWLLTYADMITLLMALFIVMWAISTVNSGKFDELKVSLKAAFSGEVLPAQGSVLPGSTAPFSQPGTPVQLQTPPQRSTAFQVPSIKARLDSMAAQHDEENLKRIQEDVAKYAADHGLAQKLQSTIDERGLEIRLLTDALMFDPGSADLKSASRPLIAHIGALLQRPGIPNPVRVEGNTDSTPISTGRFPSNWELSTARANAVLEYLLAQGVGPRRLSVAGYADQRPAASNATAEGRAMNRRVTILVLRRTTSPPSQGAGRP